MQIGEDRFQICYGAMTGRSSRTEMFCKQGVLKKLAKFTAKHLRQSLFFK